LIATYTALNIFVAIVVNAMHELHRKNEEKDEALIGDIAEEQKVIQDKLDELSRQLQELNKHIKS
jgi:peptidoglycan hydrolase CwlO-like protein